MIMDFPFEVDVVRTERSKSASIEVNGETVRIVVPKTLSDQRINELISKRSAWIRQKLAAHASTPEPSKHEFVNGEAFAYLGRNYRLKLLNSDGYSVKLKHGYLEVSYRASADRRKNETVIRSLLTTWYKSHAYDKLREKTSRYSDLIGVKPSSVSVQTFKARWGSCLSSGEVSFNWKIILAPHRIVDYIVVHELCHLIEHNHSPRFWAAVENYCTDYLECRQWLKDHGAELTAFLEPCENRNQGL
jgi:predicted metal-dependent hydrolase